MKKRLTTYIVAAALLFFPLQIGIPATPLGAVNPFQTCSDTKSDTTLCKGSADKLFGPGSLWNNIINLLLFVIGIISVIVIIIGGIRYVVSAGDQSAITAAKNTILYAVVGLIVAVMASAIVNLVLSKL